MIKLPAVGFEVCKFCPPIGGTPMMIAVPQSALEKTKADVGIVMLWHIRQLHPNQANLEHDADELARYWHERRN